VSATGVAACCQQHVLLLSMSTLYVQREAGPVTFAWPFV